MKGQLCLKDFDDKLCPLCGNPNGCQHGQASCWCTSVEFPAHVLDMIPEHLKNRACVCKACLEKYQ